MAIAALAVGAAAYSMYIKNKSSIQRARFASQGFPIPGGGPGTHQLTQATPPETAAILRGAARIPDKDIIYTLKNLRAVDNSFSTGAYVGTGKSEGHTESAHGEFSYKNQDILRNSTLAIPVTVPRPAMIRKISIAGAEYNGSSYLGGIGMPRGPMHALLPAMNRYVQFPIAGMQAENYPNVPVAGAYRAFGR